LNAKFAAIIFDMDGTLVDSEVVWRDAEIAFFRTLGIEYTDEVRQQIIGLRLDEMFTRLKAHYGLPQSVAELEAGMEAVMLPLIPKEVVPKPGARELIDYAAHLGIPYCIASSSPMSIIKAVVESQGWTTLIPHLYTADAVPLGKPAPDVYLYAARSLGVEPAACLALEDSPNGARAAVAAGMTCYAVPDFHSDPAELRAITPHVFADLQQVLAALQA
jgi:HAD superfamily hydrolase (TIGR01509 family)